MPPTCRCTSSATAAPPPSRGSWEINERENMYSTVQNIRHNAKGMIPGVYKGFFCTGWGGGINYQNWYVSAYGWKRGFLGMLLTTIVIMSNAPPPPTSLLSVRHWLIPSLSLDPYNSPGGPNIENKWYLSLFRFEAHCKLWRKERSFVLLWLCTYS